MKIPFELLCKIYFLKEFQKKSGFKLLTIEQMTIFASFLYNNSYSPEALRKGIQRLGDRDTSYFGLRDEELLQELFKDKLNQKKIIN